MSLKKINRTGYMCSVDFYHEMDADIKDGIPVYSTVEFLKKSRLCVEQCGIVKVKVTLEEWVQRENFGDKNDKKI